MKETRHCGARNDHNRETLGPEQEFNSIELSLLRFSVPSTSLLADFFEMAESICQRKICESQKQFFHRFREICEGAIAQRNKWIKEHPDSDASGIADAVNESLVKRREELHKTELEPTIALHHYHLQQMKSRIYEWYCATPNPAWKSA